MSKRDEILDAAGPLFSRHGLRKVTTDDIARAGRISKATIYRHYANKQEILRDVIRRETAALLERLRAAVAAERTAEAQLRAFVLTKLNSTHDYVNLYEVTAETLAENWSHAEELKREFIREEKAILRGILDAGVASGELDVPDPGINAHFLVLSIHTLELPWAVEGLDLTVARQADLMLQPVMNGLRARPKGD